MGPQAARRFEGCVSPLWVPTGGAWLPFARLGAALGAGFARKGMAVGARNSARIDWTLGFAQFFARRFTRSVFELSCCPYERHKPLMAR
jgi:hypothetical protein